MEELKKCPFCGGKACATANYSKRRNVYYVFIKCDVCGAQGKAYISEEDPAQNEWQSIACEDAQNAWNLRTGADHEAPV